MYTGNAHVGGGPRGNDRLGLRLGQVQGQDSDYRYRGKA